MKRPTRAGILGPYETSTKSTLRQVQTRADQDVDALIEELQAGHREALRSLDEMQDHILERRIPVAFAPSELSVAEFIVVAGPRHEGNHLNDIEAALKKQ
jgi:hypothetical protein